MGWFQPVQPFWWMVCCEWRLLCGCSILEHWLAAHTVCMILWNCLLPCPRAEGISILREMEAIDGRWLKLAIWVGDLGSRKRKTRNSRVALIVGTCTQCR